MLTIELQALLLFVFFSTNIIQQQVNDYSSWPRVDGGTIMSALVLSVIVLTSAVLAYTTLTTFSICFLIGYAFIIWKVDFDVWCELVTRLLQESYSHHR